MAADMRGLRIDVVGSARFVNNTPETWTMHVMRLSPHVLSPGDTWTTPQLLRPGLIAHVFCRCQCTTGPASRFNGRWMYHPLVSIGWEHEIKYWAWRYGMWFESGEECPKRYYTEYLSLMEGVILLEHMFKIGMKDMIVDKFAEGLRFFMGGDEKGNVRDPSGGRSWVLACLDDGEIAGQLPTLAVMLRGAPALVPKVQDLLETLIADEQVLASLVPACLPMPGDAAADGSAEPTSAPNSQLMMSIMAHVNGRIMQDPELMMLMGAMGDFTQLAAGSQAPAVFAKVMMQLPPQLLTKIMKRAVGILEPSARGDEPLPPDVPRLDAFARELTPVMLEVMKNEDANSIITQHKNLMLKLAESYPILVLYMSISSLSTHGLVVDEFMALATAMNIERRTSVLEKRRSGSGLGRRKSSEDSSAIDASAPIPHEVYAQFKSILEVGRVDDTTTRATSVKQMEVSPVRWALSVEQFVDFVDLCKTTPKWDELKRSRKIVSMYDMDPAFVRAVSRGTGCSVALLMNQASPLASKVMLSHCWGEEVAECSEALEGFCYDRGVPLGTPVWFCLFSIYQPGSEAGDPGPGIDRQVSLDPSPFQQVIRAGGVRRGWGMVVLHTTTAEVYDRLWCVHEIDEAMEQGVAVLPACSSRFAMVQSIARAVAESDGYMPGIADFTVNTNSAECGSQEDTARIRKAVEAKDGGYNRLDRVINEFRGEMLKNDLAVWLKPDASRVMQEFHLHGITELERGAFVALLSDLSEEVGSPIERAVLDTMIDEMFPSRPQWVPIDDFMSFVHKDR